MTLAELWSRGRALFDFVFPPVDLEDMGLGERKMAQRPQEEPKPTPPEELPPKPEEEEEKPKPDEIPPRPEASDSSIPPPFSPP